MKNILGSSPGSNSGQFFHGGGGGGMGDFPMHMGGHGPGPGGPGGPPGRGKGGKGKGFGNMGGSRNSDIAQNFYDFRSRYNNYQRKFLFWESFNIVTVTISWFLTHWLLNKKFNSYGVEVIDFLGSEKEIMDKDQYYYHDPQCELFPTEVMG